MDISSTAALTEKDLEIVVERAWKLFKSLVNAPEELRDFQDATLLVFGSLRLLVEHMPTSQLNPLLQDTLRDHIARVSIVITAAEDGLDDLRQRRLSTTLEVTRVARSLLIHGARLSSFNELLQSNAQRDMIRVLEQPLPPSNSGIQDMAWESATVKLQAAGHSLSFINENYFVINGWLEQKAAARPPTLVSSSIPTNVPELSTVHTDPTLAHWQTELPVQVIAPSYPSTSADVSQDIRFNAHEDLPGYESGTQPSTVQEKAHMQEQMTAIANVDAALSDANQLVDEDPPDYTLVVDESAESVMDEELTRYIREAVSFELRRRYKERELHPTKGPFVYSWLPVVIQAKFANRAEMVSLLDAKSFTIMAYETAPRVTDELKGLLSILLSSAESPGDNKIFLEAVDTVQIMIKALSRFVSIQHPTHGASMSDLDVLDYEYDTARAISTRPDFPSASLELARNSYCNLLTYIMGLNALMKDIFTGHIYVLRSRQNLARLCAEKHVTQRKAWISKRLAEWETVDEAVLFGRNWYAQNPVRAQALSALKSWQSSIEFILGQEPPTTVSLTIKGVNGLQRTHGYRCDVILYADKFRGDGIITTSRYFDSATTTLRDTPCPAWDQEFLINLPKKPNMIDVVLNDVGFRIKEVGRVRLKFRAVSGVENSLFGKDLLYGFDEELSIPLVQVDSSKGKGPEALMLDFRLAWLGRFEMLQEAGLMSTPPGKMFRMDWSGVPSSYGIEE